VLFLDGELDRHDQDFISDLYGHVVNAGLRRGEFHNNFIVGLADDRGLVVILVVGEKYRGNGTLSKVLAGHRYIVIRFGERRYCNLPCRTTAAPSFFAFIMIKTYARRHVLPVGKEGTGSTFGDDV
jgi:hypothetical protein